MLSFLISQCYIFKMPCPKCIAITKNGTSCKRNTCARFPCSFQHMNIGWHVRRRTRERRFLTKSTPVHARTQAPACAHARTPARRLLIGHWTMALTLMSRMSFQDLPRWTGDRITHLMIIVTEGYTWASWFGFKLYIDGLMAAAIINELHLCVSTGRRARGLAALAQLRDSLDGR